MEMRFHPPQTEGQGEGRALKHGRESAKEQ